MKNTADKVIQYAKSQVGYLEKDSNKLLDDFKKNAGSRNYTKYARDFLKATGLNFQGQAWCDMFVDTCFVATYGEKKAKSLLGGFDAYTVYSANHFKKMNQWYNYPEPGDIIFFKNSERINHTGIVVAVSNTKVYTVEGNTSSGTEVVENGGGVFEKSYWLSNQRIAGYGRPNYDNPFTKPSKTVTKDSSENDIGWLQFQLNKAFKALKSDTCLKVDKSYGKLTQGAVCEFWKLLGWNKDGKDDGTRAGAKTINKLNTF